MDDNIIILKEVYAGYNNNNVLENVNLEVKKGDFLGIIGPNGGGKTTLLKLITGILKPYKGDIKVFGKNPLKFTKQERRKIGYVRQQNTIDMNFPVKVLDVVLMGLYVSSGYFKRLSKTEIKKAYIALEKVDMQKYADSHIGVLSGGQRQRVFIARAIVNDPELLILDEPTTGVDAKQQNNFFSMIMNLKSKYDLTVLMVSHDLNFVAREINKVFCVNRKTHIHGSANEILENEHMCEVCGLDTSIFFNFKK